ncbi:MAG: carboxypeptidase regulatory-like domain-containing protein [Planctomycetota bacterium]|nr:carboxypeptidase regulatory-like domain-containing protein [Planctomycetota bacterium]
MREAFVRTKKQIAGSGSSLALFVLLAVAATAVMLSGNRAVYAQGAVPGAVEFTNREVLATQNVGNLSEIKRIDLLADLCVYEWGSDTVGDICVEINGHKHVLNPNPTEGSTFFGAGRIGAWGVKTFRNIPLSYFKEGTNQIKFLPGTSQGYIRLGKDGKPSVKLKLHRTLDGAAEQADGPKITGKSVVKGKIIHALTGQPLAGAKVSIECSGRSEVYNAYERITTTDDKGEYKIGGLAAHTAIVRAWKPGYYGNANLYTVIPEKSSVTVDFVLNPKDGFPNFTFNPAEGFPSGRVAGKICDLTGSLLAADKVRVLVNGAEARVIGSTYVANDVKEGNAEVKVIAPGYKDSVSTVVVKREFTTLRDVYLSPTESLPEKGRVEVKDSAIRITLDNGTYIVMPKKGGLIDGFGQVGMGSVKFRRNVPTGLPELVVVEQNKLKELKYISCRYLGYAIEGNTIIIHTALEGDGGTEAELDWVFRPESIRTWNRGFREYHGLTYGYRFRSKNHNLHQLRQKVSWELGGSAAGNVLVNQGRFSGLREYKIDLKDRLLIFSDRLINLQSSSEGDLIVYPARKVVKFAGEDAIYHCDEGRFESAKHILFSASGPQRHSTLSEWTAVFDTLRKRYQTLYGLEEIQQSVPTALVMLKRGPSHSFDTDCYGVANDMLPQIAALNFKRIWLVCSEEVPTSYNDPMFGGMKGVKYLCDRAHRLGVKVFLWTSSPHLDDASLLLRLHPEWIARDAQGRFPTKIANYRHWLSLRSGYINYALDIFKNYREKTGLDGFIFDLCDLNDFDHIQMIAQMQTYGYSIFLPEALNLMFGILTADDKSLAYNLCNGHEDRAFNTTYGPGGLQPHRIREFDYYKLIANRGPYILNYLFIKDDPLLGTVKRANADFNTVCHLLQVRNLLPDENGVEWFNATNQDVALFSFKPFQYRIDGKAAVLNVTTKKSFAAEGSFEAEAKHTYWIKKDR